VHPAPTRRYARCSNGASDTDRWRVGAASHSDEYSGAGNYGRKYRDRPMPKINMPQEKLDDLRRRILATQWPEKETVADTSQGVPLATMQQLARYWATDYDWRKAEAKLNALPQFVTNIDGLDIHFIHVKSPHPNALPLIITHGWPGSIIEQIKLIDPLSNPQHTAELPQMRLT
jgi:hypothetical protein